MEAIIKEARERGDFENMKSRGKPGDLSASFEIPPPVRAAQSPWKYAGKAPA